MIDKMYWACGEVLSASAQFAEAPNLPSPDIMKRRIATLLEDMERKATELGIQKRDLDDAKYAIVAFIDEQLFRARWAGRQEWMLEPLQLLYFNENTAGEGFFERLDALERDPARVHVLEVYYLCLALGFQGKYAVRGGDGLGAVTDRIVGILARATPRGDTLSPHDAPADTRGMRARRETPVLVVGGIVVAVAILVAVTLKIALSSATSDATARITTSTQAANAGTKK
ncbi:MAG: type IVB secretion system protein IcmH/DotU [Labilithrix sp.]|nr:type IVB secretion system protein IcmH/DotU [Labilithrix sp.]MCW5811451.1 type IVB secretion system protein IcmH/DotU [Labilithrix sp.]